LFARPAPAADIDRRLASARLGPPAGLADSMELLGRTKGIA
jgi:hypothetical protein